MKIIVNGHNKIYQSNLTLHKLLMELGYIDKKIAVEINEEIIPRSHYKEKIIINGDTIEIISAIGGG